MKNFNALDLTLLAVLGFGCVACVGITRAIAAEETPVAMPAVERMREREEVRTEARENRVAAFESRVQDRVINLANNVKGRLSAALDRMDNIATRLETRINKLALNGVETGIAKSRLQEARVAIETARTKLNTIPSVETAIRGDTPRESFAVIRTEFVAVRDLVRQSHTLLTDTVVLLKEAVRAQESGTSVSDTVSTGTIIESVE